MKNIDIGLTGWGDHPAVYDGQTTGRSKLAAYAAHFPVVEVDSAFYAIQSQANYQKWVKETPPTFSFVIKAFSKLTGHDRSQLTLSDVKSLIENYLDSIQPVVQANKLNAILFQFPPWFDLNKENIKRLRIIKELIPDLPLALEFRNRTWFSEHNKQQTLQFMKDEQWIHSICDEPQAGEGSVPTVLEATHPEQTVIRFHGRNVHGWNKNGRADWRAVRFLYRYNEQELMVWVDKLTTLKESTKRITILFNNNSGGDAADNAKQLINLLGIRYDKLNPRQINLFDEL